MDRDRPYSKALQPGLLKTRPWGLLGSHTGVIWGVVWNKRKGPVEPENRPSSLCDLNLRASVFTMLVPGIIFGQHFPPPDTCPERQNHDLTSFLSHSWALIP